MIDVERFEPEEDCGCGGGRMKPRQDGDWVRYEDYYALSNGFEAAELKPWRDELSEIIGHLGSAITQSVASDDQIIMDHVKAAHEIAKIVRRKA